MTAKPIAKLLADLGVLGATPVRTSLMTAPYSESQIKTLKHHPTTRQSFRAVHEVVA
jgi:hypothetical protein